MPPSGAIRPNAGPRGEPLLRANGPDGSGGVNPSFEREFGKLIGIEDTLAKVVEDKSNRAIRFGFLPI